MKVVLFAALLFASGSAFAVEHIIVEKKPASEESPLEFSVVSHDPKASFMLSYVPGEKRGDLRGVQLYIKEKKRGSEDWASWLRSPTVQHIGVFRMTWKDRDEAFTKMLSFKREEVDRMVAIVGYWKDAEEIWYVYPLAEIFREEANQQPQQQRP